MVDQGRIGCSIPAPGESTACLSAWVWRQASASGTGSLRKVAGISIHGAVRELLESDAVAHVVTLDEDRSPHVTAAWVGVEGVHAHSVPLALDGRQHSISG